jgi:aspartyl-tRNA(Asn)/glutamyl-tRNA(Gln) amidotransferase subunit C
MLGREEVLRIAKLARLELSEDEIERYQQQMARVLDYFKELQAIPTQADAVVKHVPRDSVSFRGDKILPFGNARGLLENAPALEADGFLLPTVVEHE